MLDILPVELIDLSLSSLTPTELAAMGPLNRQFHSISSRILYKSLDLSNGQSVRCLRTLSRSPSLASLVRSLHLDWSDLGSPLPALLVLLHRVLLGLTNLNSLILELAVKHVGMGTSWVLRDCKFDLKLFISSIRCDQLLAQFLESQPNLVELGLRGFGNPDLFALSPTSLPHLQSLRAMRAGPLVFRSVVQGRPIENVSVGLVPCDGFTALDVLDLSTKSIKRLTIMTFNFSTPESILTEISRRMPSLVALHVVALNTRPLPTVSTIY